MKWRTAKATEDGVLLQWFPVDGVLPSVKISILGQRGKLSLRTQSLKWELTLFPLGIAASFDTKGHIVFNCDNFRLAWKELGHRQWTLFVIAPVTNLKHHWA